ncbi:oligosaccharide repeat unit polymerase [Paraburkholderia sp.]|uniref:oligosaccharide repeat unit polymerase n=1 Tax=Paraburkholderia sp. TaxID=1926495 RepID=UPI00238A80E3|nr:oligosaccharide repeat unit polymerase [Paraburkholderia sp.]MDE1179733.1 oligosaccharide repeat unit polymerase [Paraburkholderia sp.]
MSARESVAKNAVAGTRRIGPHLLFFAVYAGYNLLGLLDMPWSMSGAYDKALCWELFVSGASGFALGWLLFGNRTYAHVEKAFPERTSRQLSMVFAALFAGCIGITVVTNGGIPLLMGEARFGNSALVSNLAPLYGFWLLVRTISDKENGRRVSPVQPVLYVAGILLLGYRSPVLAFVAVYFVYLMMFLLTGRKALMVSVLAGALLIGFSAALAFFRVAQTYDVDRFFTNIDFRFIADHRYLLPFAPALSMFDYSQNTIATIGAALHDHKYGELLLSNYKTFLPGRHWGARNIIGDIVGARWVDGHPMSITPTLQGALYVDFGHAGVFAGFFVIAFGIARLHAFSLRNGVIAKFSFCYLMTLLLMSIHSGYWDVNFIFFLLFLGAVWTFDYLKKLGGVRC